MKYDQLVATGSEKLRLAPLLVLGVVLACSSPLVYAHSISDRFETGGPDLFQMIDGEGPGGRVTLVVDASGSQHDGNDFGYSDWQTYHPPVSWCNWGNAEFSGGARMDIAMRKHGEDVDSNASDAEYFHLSDNRDYTTQNYFSPIDSADSHHWVVTDRNDRKPSRFWDLDRDHDRDGKVRLWTQSDFDDMRFLPCTPTPVPLPSSIWLLGVGMLVLAFLAPFARRRSDSSRA